MNANEKHADLGCRTLLVHAQYAGIESSVDKEEVIVDLLTSLLHLRKDYNFNLDDLLQQAKVRFEAEQPKIIQPKTISQVEIDELLTEGDSLEIEDAISNLGANCDYQGDGVWNVNGKHLDARDVKEFLERHVPAYIPAPAMA